jgi:recombination protein RecA
MKPEKSRLEQLTLDLNRRWGKDTLRPLSELREVVACIATGFPKLDQALGVGGIPRGRITELTGIITSGMSTLALRLIASAQASGDMAVYVDMQRTFDADYALRCGVQLERVLVCRPRNVVLGLDIAQDLIASSAIGILIFDLGLDNPAIDLAQSIRHLLPALSVSSCALIFLTTTDEILEQTTLRLRIEKEHWLRRRNDVTGYRSRVSILKNKLAPIARPVTITIPLNRSIP